MGFVFVFVESFFYSSFIFEFLVGGFYVSVFVYGGSSGNNNFKFLFYDILEDMFMYMLIMVLGFLVLFYLGFYCGLGLIGKKNLKFMF